MLPRKGPTLAAVHEGGQPTALVAAKDMESMPTSCTFTVNDAHSQDTTALYRVSYDRGTVTNVTVGFSSPPSLVETLSDICPLA